MLTLVAKELALTYILRLTLDAIAFLRFTLKTPFLHQYRDENQICSAWEMTSRNANHMESLQGLMQTFRQIETASWSVEKRGDHFEGKSLHLCGRIFYSAVSKVTSFDL